MRAWWAYWVSIGIAAALWVGGPLVAGRDGFRTLLHGPASLAILLAPLIVAGLNLIAFRESHEEVCRYEAERHPWFRALVRRGYSARVFAWTGAALLAGVAVILGARLAGAF